jgi:hypothetical protein
VDSTETNHSRVVDHILDTVKIHSLVVRNRDIDFNRTDSFNRIATVEGTIPDLI